MRRICLFIGVCVLASVGNAVPHWVRIACTSGPPTLEQYDLPAFEKALDFAGRNGVDLALLPEYVHGEMVPEPMAGPSAELMSRKAKQYRMYVAGTIARQTSSTIYNTALLFGRNGALIGTYDKIHLYGLELEGGKMTAGTTVSVFQTDIGRVGFVTCSDIGHTDVARGVAAKGADVLLFPNLGYDPAVARTRAEENRLWLVASSRSGAHNIWDGSGTDVMTTGTERPLSCKDVVQIRVGELPVLLATIELDDVTTGPR